MSFQDRLEKMNSDWGTRKDAAVGGVTPGTYNTRLQSAELGQNSKEALQVVVEYLVMEGEQAGNVARDYMQLETDKGPGFFRRWCETLGFECPNDSREIENTLAEIVAAAPGVRIKITPRKDSDFTNIRVLKRLDDDDIPAVPVDPSADHGNDDDAYDPDATTATVEDISGGSSDPTRVDLEKLEIFCTAYGLTDVDESNAKQKLSAFGWNVTGVTADEADLLHSLGVPVEGYVSKAKPTPPPVRTAPPARTPPPAAGKQTPPPVGGKAAPPKAAPAPAAPAKDSDDKIMEAAKAFCASYNLDFGKTRTVAGFAKFLGEYAWSKADLDAAGIKLMKNLGIELK